MIRARIIAKGKVQRVGYRDEVESIALALGITGFVRNSDEKDKVEIVCEADEKVIDKFLEKLRVKNELVNVEELVVEKSRATGELKTFALIRGDKDTELVERLEEAAKHLKGVKKGLGAIEIEVKGVGTEVKGSREDIKDVREEVKGSREDIKDVREEVKGSREDIRAMHKDMNERFDAMAKRYDIIAKGLAVGLKMMQEEFIKSRKETRAEFAKSRKELAIALNGFTKVVRKLMKK